MTLFLTALYLLVREVLATPLRSLANDVLAASKASDPFFPHPHIASPSHW